MIKVGIITASDKGSQGDRKDLSAPVIEELVKSIGGEVAAYAVVPDEQALLEEKLKEYADEKSLDLVFTTGGTGFSPRDVTPEATLAVVDRLAPGIAKPALEYLKITPKGAPRLRIRGATLINLPGVPKACRNV